MDTTKILSEFKKRSPKYYTLSENIKQSLELFLKQENIGFLSIDSRVKEEMSFDEKIRRKGYVLPFDECEDLCGVRIICYYRSDIDKIREIIYKEFNVLSEENKEELLEYDQFGYRSDHFVVKIKEEWLIVPNYRELNNLKAEIQVRTVLMHSWAELQHKLAYKKDEIPRELRRQFSRLSAKLEESDEQFEILKNDIEKIRREITENVKNGIINFKDMDLTLDNLQVYLDYMFYNRKSNIEETRALFEELNRVGITMKDIFTAYDICKEEIEEIESDDIEEHFLELQVYDDKFIWHQVGAVRVLLDITCEKYLNSKERELSRTDEVVIKWRAKFIENGKVSI